MDDFGQQHFENLGLFSSLHIKCLCLIIRNTSFITVLHFYSYKHKGILCQHENTKLTIFDSAVTRPDLIGRESSLVRIRGAILDRSIFS